MKSSGVRVDRNWGKLKSRLTLDARGLPMAVEEALGETASHAIGHMQQAIIEAETMTGHERVAARGGGIAGRVETGAMITSLKYITRNTASGNVTVNLGYQDDPPDYTKYQEFGTRTIAAVNAKQVGFNYMVAKVMDNIGYAWDQLDEDAKAGRAYRRAANFRHGNASRIDNREGWTY